MKKMISEDTKALLEMNAKIARIEAIKIDVKSMEARNTQRVQDGDALTFNEWDFTEKANEIIQISEEIKNIGKDETE